MAAIAPPALAAEPARDEPAPARWQVGGVARWWQAELQLSEYARAPEASPPVDADRAEVGERFWWRGAGAWLAARADMAGDRSAAFLGVRLGVLAFDLHEESRANSVLNPSTPRDTVTAASRPGLGAGMDFGFSARVPGTPLWAGADGRLDLGVTSLDDAELFGEPPLRGTTRLLEVALALHVAWPVAAWRPYLGGRLQLLDLVTDWELAFTSPPPTPEIAAHFGTRWPARAVLGCEWREGPVSARLELSLGAWARDWDVTLSVARAF